MHWKKLGNIYNPNNIQKKDPKLISHASTPTPIRIDKDIYRIYYSGRDKYNRSSISAFDYNLKEMKIIKFLIIPSLRLEIKIVFLIWRNSMLLL